MSGPGLERGSQRTIRNVLIALHVLAFSLAPFCYSWYGLLAFGILALLTGLGVTMGYHRLLTHESFQTWPLIRRTLAVLGLLSGEGPPIFWVAFHRCHHQHSDTAGDPHSPQIDGFWFAHVVWLWSYSSVVPGQLYTRYTRKDLSTELFMRFLTKAYVWLHLVFAVILGLVGYSIEGWYGTASMLVWGMLLRIIFVLNATWFVNSAGHLYGYRNYATRDDSRNCWWVGLLAFGEGWHNNHHYDPSSAAHGHRWYEVDLTYGVIWLLETLRLVWNVQRPHLKKTVPSRE